MLRACCAFIQVYVVDSKGGQLTADNIDDGKHCGRSARGHRERKFAWEDCTNRMIPFIARHLICPLHELLVGRKTFAFVRALEASQWLGGDELRLVQRSKLGALLAHAFDHVSFYRERLQAAGVDQRTAREEPFEALARLPLLDKSTIRENLERMTWSDMPGGLVRFNTGGSSGEPLIFYLDRRRQAYDQAARIRTHRWFGVDVGERELYLWGSPIEVARSDLLKRWRDRLFNHRLLSAFELSPRRMDEYLRVVKAYKPACLFGYPSSLALFVRHARDRGANLRHCGLKAVFVTGEVCLPGDRETIADYFEVPVADCYGSRDGGFVSHQCERGRYHITAENIVVEIIGEDGPVAMGKRGEVVLTHLDCYGMPLIRYRTGDVAGLLDEVCPCGRGLPLMQAVEGRTTDFIHLPDGTTKHALSVIYPLREMVGISQFRIMQQADYGVDVEFVLSEGQAGRPSEQQVAEAVTRVTGRCIAVRARQVSGIPVSGSGKFRYVISQAAPAFADGDERNECAAREVVCV